MTFSHILDTNKGLGVLRICQTEDTLIATWR